MTPQLKTSRNFTPALALAALIAVSVALSACATLTGAAGPTPTPTATSVPSPSATATTALVDAKPSVVAPVNGLAGLPSIADLVDTVEPAVVSIVTRTAQQDFFGRVQQVTGSGSGVIFGQDGYILTNYHVIEGMEDITVTLFDNRQFEAKVVGSNPENDLAVIKIEEKSLPTLPFRTSSSLRVGDWVVAIGNAAGLPGKPTVTLGIVSALDRSLQTDAATLNDLIQTDALINPGNSGGPLVNLQGEVVGINSAILRGSQIDGIGFAISTDTARLVADQLVRNGRVIWPRMGVGLKDIDIPTAAERNLSVREGALITEVEPGSPAAQAGVRANDVIVALDSKTIANVKALLQLLRGEYKVGQRATVAVIRGKDRREFTVTLGER